MFHNILVVIEHSNGRGAGLDARDHTRRIQRLAPNAVHRSRTATRGRILGPGCPGMIGFLERADARANKIAHRARDRIPNDVPSAAVVMSRPVKPALVRQITDGHHDLVVMGY
jgi:hypothetical protein